MNLLEYLDWISFCYKKYRENPNDISREIWIDAVNNKTKKDESRDTLKGTIATDPDKGRD